MTSRYLYEPQTRILAWAREAMRYPRPGFQFRSDAQGIAHERDGKIVGAVVFDTWSDGDCLTHVVSDGGRRWFTREFCTRAMAYPFVQVGTRRITAVVSEHNAPSLALCRKFGWTQEGRLREAGPNGEDMIVFGLLRRECRWIGPAGADIVAPAAA